MSARGQKPALVIIDNLSSMSFGTDENDNSLQDSILRWLMGLRHQGYAVLLVHHTGKNGEQRGASRREDFLDTSIRLTKPETETQGEGAAFKIEFTKERGRKANPSSLSVNLETGEHGEPVWTRLRAFPEYMRALLVIRDHHPSTTTELGKLMDVTRQAAAKHVAKLREKGYLRPTDMGMTQKGTKVLSLPALGGGMIWPSENTPNATPKTQPLRFFEVQPYQTRINPRFFRNATVAVIGCEWPKRNPPVRL